MTLPLFKLPILVIKLILETMGFIDMFVLTSASSKTKRLVKNLVTIRNHELRIFAAKTEIYFNFQHDPNPYFVEQIFSETGERQANDSFFLKIGTTNHVPSEFSKTKSDGAVLSTYWGTNMNHGAELYNALTEVFKIPIIVIRMDLDGVAVETYRLWTNWINESLSAAPIVMFVGKCSFSDYIWILKNAKTNHKLSFRVEPTEYPEYPENIEILNVDAELVAIFFGRWISVQQLKAIEAEYIFIRRVSLTDSDINTLLRYWRSSEVRSNLKLLKIFFEREANPDIVLQGMDAINDDLMKPNDALNQWNFEMANGEKCTVIYAAYGDDIPELGFEFHVGI